MEKQIHRQHQLHVLTIKLIQWIGFLYQTDQKQKKPLKKNLLRYALAAIDLFGKLSNAGDTETVLSALRARFQTLCLKGEISKHGLSYDCIFSAF